mmetsp:Transcript_26575/g.74675  ORF Transcript_26575/g.74675 Transcript_26575/m.74675 type:complete len:81 (-) Transcript_26575:2622-2864(-)
MTPTWTVGYTLVTPGPPGYIDARNLGSGSVTCSPDGSAGPAGPGSQGDRRLRHQANLGASPAAAGLDRPKAAGRSRNHHV